MNNSILYGSNVNPLKRNMEEGQFSLMRKVFRESAQFTKNNNPTKLNINATHTKNLTFQDTSSYIERRKARAIGKKEYNSPLSYRSYDPNEVAHVTRRVRQGGCVAPKKKGFTF